MTTPGKDNLRIMEGLLSWGIEQQTKTTIQPYNQNNDNKKRQPVNYGRFAQLGKGTTNKNNHTTIKTYNKNNDHSKKRQPVDYGRFAQLGKNGMLRLPCAPQSSDNGREFS